MKYRIPNYEMNIAGLSSTSCSENGQEHSPKQDDIAAIFPYLVEQWKVVPSLPIFEVSSFGRVRRAVPGKGTRVGRLLKPIQQAHGYLTVGFWANGNVQLVYVHRLVAETFLGMPATCKCGVKEPAVHHVNHNKTDNQAFNLDWICWKCHRAHHREFDKHVLSKDLRYFFESDRREAERKMAGQMKSASRRRRIGV